VLERERGRKLEEAGGAGGEVEVPYEVNEAVIKQ
jgi:hypothetical protein